jgi:hypothetical protein
LNSQSPSSWAAPRTDSRGRPGGGLVLTKSVLSLERCLEERVRGGNHAFGVERLDSLGVAEDLLDVVFETGRTRRQ